MSFKDSAKFANVSRSTWSKRWYELNLESPRNTSPRHAVVFDTDKKIYKVAIISDLHFGSKWANTEFLNAFVDHCKNQQIGTLLNVGDTIDGIMPWEQHYKERLLHSAYSYEEYTWLNYPKGFSKSYFVEGNHCTTLKKYEDENYSFGARISKWRKDLTFVPTIDKFANPITLKGGLRVCLYHGTKSCSDSTGRNRDIKLRSKVLGMMANNIDANLYLFGHCHRRHIMEFMGKTIYGVGCFQNTTPYLVSRGSLNDVCGLIVRYQKRDDGGFLFVPEFIDEKSLGE